ncbi:MAG: hypothetical protein U0547_02500 [Dehalococcoidia bacterium]
MTPTAGRDHLPDLALGLLEPLEADALLEATVANQAWRAEAGLYAQAVEALVLSAPPIPIPVEALERITAGVAARLPAGSFAPSEARARQPRLFRRGHQRREDESVVHLPEPIPVERAPLPSREVAPELLAPLAGTPEAPAGQLPLVPVEPPAAESNAPDALETEASTASPSTPPVVPAQPPSRRRLFGRRGRQEREARQPQAAPLDDEPGEIYDFAPVSPLPPAESEDAISAGPLAEVAGVPLAPEPAEPEAWSPEDTVALAPAPEAEEPAAPVGVEPEAEEPAAPVKVEPEAAERVALAPESEPEAPVVLVEAEPEPEAAVAPVELEPEPEEPVALVEAEPALEPEPAPEPQSDVAAMAEPEAPRRRRFLFWRRTAPAPEPGEAAPAAIAPEPEPEPPAEFVEVEPEPEAPTALVEEPEPEPEPEPEAPAAPVDVEPEPEPEAPAAPVEVEPESEPEPEALTAPVEVEPEPEPEEPAALVVEAEPEPEVALEPELEPEPERPRRRFLFWRRKSPAADTALIEPEPELEFETEAPAPEAESPAALVPAEAAPEVPEALAPEVEPALVPEPEPEPEPEPVAPVALAPEPEPEPGPEAPRRRRFFRRAPKPPSPKDVDIDEDDDFADLTDEELALYDDEGNPINRGGRSWGGAALLFAFLTLVLGGAAAVFGYGWREAQLDANEARTLLTTRAGIITMEGERVRGTVYLEASGRGGLGTFEGLTAGGQGTIYKLWADTPDGPRLLRVFRPRELPAYIEIRSIPPVYSRLFLTLEPDVSPAENVPGGPEIATGAAPEQLHRK